MFKSKPVLIALLALAWTGCQSLQQKNVSLVEERIFQLRKLPRWSAQTCRVAAELNEPARARYANMFPDEEASDARLQYQWQVSQSRCEVMPTERSPLLLNHQAFLQVGLCSLTQSMIIHSPFSGLNILPSDVEDGGDWIRVKSDAVDNSHGLFLNKKEFVIEKRASDQGVSRAKYSLHGDLWLPDEMEQVSGATIIHVDEINYAQGSHLESFVISVGVQSVEKGREVIRHSRALISDCTP